MSDLRQRGNINNAEKWIRRCLDVDEPSVWADRILESLQRASGNITDLDAAMFEDLGKETAGATVEVIRGEEFVSRTKQAAYRSDGRQPAGKTEGAVGIFQAR